MSFLHHIGVSEWILAGFTACMAALPVSVEFLPRPRRGDDDGAGAERDPELLH